MTVTRAMLDTLVKRLNEVTGMPVVPYIGHEPQGGAFLIDSAYNMYALHRMCKEGTGETDVFGGYYTKRQLYDLIRAFLRGYEFANQGV